MPPKSHGRPKQSGRAAVHAAAHAASRHKASNVEVGSGVEEHVRSLLAGLDVGGGDGRGGGAPPPASAADAAAAYDGAVAAGFTHAQARRALTAMMKGGASASLTIDAVLDWLCLHTPPADLPKRFAGAARAAAAAAGPVTVVARAKDKGRQAPPPPPPRDLPPSESESEASDGGAAAAAATAAAAAAAAADKEASKAYILRYMQEASESESGGSDVDGYGRGGGGRTATTSTTTAPPTTSDIEFSKYAVWADPRAVERRRAERARAALPPDDRRARVAEEWAIVRAEAARVKAAGDGARQKAVGPLLGALKREAAELGLTDKELEGEEEEAVSEPGSSASSSSSGAGMGLFADGDDGDNTMQWDAPSSKAPTVDDLLAAALPPPSQRRKKGILPLPIPPRTDPKPPKALLQTLCAKWGVPPPPLREAGARRVEGGSGGGGRALRRVRRRGRRRARGGQGPPQTVMQAAPSALHAA